MYQQNKSLKVRAINSMPSINFLKKILNRPMKG